MSETLERKYASLEAELAALEDSRQQAVAASDEEYEGWLAGLRDSSDAQWQAVVPEAFESTGNEEFAIQEDGAVLLTGSVPDTVEHIFTFTPQSSEITAIKVDALTDEAIPGKGPGRGDAQRSNFILSELSCDLLTDKETVSLTLQDPTADFSQANWPVAASIDGDRKTGWAISPQFGQPHWASYALSEPIKMEPSHRLRITLAQYFGRGRIIGKPRISIYTGDTTYLNVDPSLRELATKKKLSKADHKKLRGEFDKQQPRDPKIESRNRACQEGTRSDQAGHYLGNGRERRSTRNVRDDSR